MSESDCIKSLMQDNIVVAVGCTEPVAVSLAVAKAKEILKEKVENIVLYLSGNIIKNAMGVGIPGTNMVGLPIAIALGVVCGDSTKGLSVLDKAKDNVQKAKEWLPCHKIEINQKQTEEKLFIEVHCFGKNNNSKVIISKTHTHFSYIGFNNETILDSQENSSNCQKETKNFADTLTAKTIWSYATNESLENIEWINDTAKLNSACSDKSLEGEYGLQIGKKLFATKDQSYRQEIIARTCAASDARMDGITLPIYSNSGSGNQGITCTLPVYYFGLKSNCSSEKITRGLILSHLMSIYIKNKIGRLSAMCGVVNASMGACCGMVYLANGSFEQMCWAVRNMINTITGLVCDGAKPSCALKISAGLNSAFDSMLLAKENIVVDQTDGIAQKDIDQAINDLARIGKDSMNEVDKMILNIMTSKPL